MDFQEILNRRVSCRKYEDRPVSRELLTALVDAGRRAPSGCNLQPWRFIVVDDGERKAMLAQATQGTDASVRINTYTAKAPAFIVIVREPPAELTKTQQYIMSSCDNKAVADADIGCAAMQICLAATDLGLGSVIIAMMDQAAVKAALNVPETLDIGLIITVGYSAAEPKQRPRKPLNEVLCWNSYSQPEQDAD